MSLFKKIIFGCVSFFSISNLALGEELTSYIKAPLGKKLIALRSFAMNKGVTDPQLEELNFEFYTYNFDQKPEDIIRQLVQKDCWGECERYSQWQPELSQYKEKITHTYMPTWMNGIFENKLAKVLHSMGDEIYFTNVGFSDGDETGESNIYFTAPQKHWVLKLSYLETN